MNKASYGDNLIFLISQPRSGSTMLQRILGAHPDIHTLSEPWLMLHPLYALRPEGHEAEYNAHLAFGAVRGFIEKLPKGEEDYLNGLRVMYGNLYAGALENSGKKFFLDKTPRYYFIISELRRVFPEAHYIILLRNPLAVLCSILKTWVKRNWLSLHRFKHDLVTSLRLLNEGIEQLGEKGIVVQYERLISDPEGEVRVICNRLGVEFTPDFIEYGGYDQPRWEFGDNTEIYRHKRPVAEKNRQWTQTLEDAQVWRLANDYLDLLGPDTLNKMGYSYKELRAILDSNRPRRAMLRLTFPLTWLLEEPRERSALKTVSVRLLNSLQVRGAWGAAIESVRRIGKKLG